MLAEAATIEAAWAIEPHILEDTLAAEIAAISAQQVGSIIATRW